MIKWNKADTQSEYLKHQMDCLDYWSVWLARQRMQVQENLIDHSYKFQDFSSKKKTLPAYTCKLFTLI